MTTGTREPQGRTMSSHSASKAPGKVPKEVAWQVKSAFLSLSKTMKRMVQTNNPHIPLPPQKMKVKNLHPNQKNAQ
jgi:hypothetical protein